MDRLRIGLLGAARIAGHGIVAPVAAEPRAVLVAVAARDAARAVAFAREHDVARAYGDYTALIEDGDVDLLYIATPPAFHALWAQRAIAAGKHVLVEKPFSLNAAEARDILALAERHDVRVFEAMHAPHHPLFARVLELVREGAVGAIRRIEATFAVAVRQVPDEFRWHAALGGGALMDLGVYPLAFVRRLLGEAFAVTRASARFSGDVDAEFDARLTFDSGAVADVSSSMTAPFESHLTIEGEAGVLHVVNPIIPHRGSQLTLSRAVGCTTEEGGGPTSWTAQLHAICDTLIDGATFLLPRDDYVRSMEAIEKIRVAGGWPALPMDKVRQTR